MRLRKGRTTIVDTFSLRRPQLTMAKQTISKFVSVALGLLVFIFGVMLLPILLRVLVGIALPLFTPKTGGLRFSISRRAFTTALLVFWVGIAAALVLIVRALRRRHLT